MLKKKKNVIWFNCSPKGMTNGTNRDQLVNCKNKREQKEMMEK